MRVLRTIKTLDFSSALPWPTNFTISNNSFLGCFCLFVFFPQSVSSQEWQRCKYRCCEIDHWLEIWTNFSSAVCVLRFECLLYFLYIYIANKRNRSETTARIWLRSTCPWWPPLWYTTSFETRTAERPPRLTTETAKVRRWRTDFSAAMIRAASVLAWLYM